MENETHEHEWQWLIPEIGMPFLVGVCFECKAVNLKDYHAEVVRQTLMKATTNLGAAIVKSVDLWDASAESEQTEMARGFIMGMRSVYDSLFQAVAMLEEK